MGVAWKIYFGKITGVAERRRRQVSFRAGAAGGQEKEAWAKDRSGCPTLYGLVTLSVRVV